jgi:hypothetical protein
VRFSASTRAVRADYANGLSLEKLLPSMATVRALWGGGVAGEQIAERIRRGAALLARGDDVAASVQRVVAPVGARKPSEICCSAFVIRGSRPASSSSLVVERHDDVLQKARHPRGIALPEKRASPRSAASRIMSTSMSYARPQRRWR